MKHYIQIVPIKMRLTTSRKILVMMIFIVVAFIMGGSSKQINLNKCQDHAESIFDSQGDLWTVPSSLMTDFSEDTKFRLENKALKCDNFYKFSLEIPQILDDDIGEVFVKTNQTTEIQIEIQNENGLPSDNVTYVVIDSDRNTVNDNYISPKTVAAFTPSGYLFLNNEHYFRLSEYCIQSISSTAIGIRVCQPNCESVESPCIPICCSLDKVLFHNDPVEKCFQAEVTDKISEYQPTLYRDVYHKLTPEEGATIFPHFYKHMPRCTNGQKLTSYPFRRIRKIPGTIVRVLSNGRVKILHPLRRSWKELHDFCLAGLVTLPERGRDNSNESLSDTQILLQFSGKEEDQILYVCGDYSTNEVVAPHFYVPVYFINSFFLFVTALVYILLWEKQNVHGWTVLSFVLAMFFMYIFLAWSHLSALFHKAEVEFQLSPPFLCHFVGIFAHFFFLATFCWLSVINFDLWWTFKSMAPVSGRSKGVKRFICYMIFAWGTPAIIVGVGLILQNVFPDPLSQVKVPGYGSVSCFLEPSMKGVYLYYDIGVLMGINLIFMGLTVFTIYEFKKETQAVDSARSNNSQSLSAKLFFKLFVVMGVSWIFEVISWSQSVEETILYWIVLDMFNVLQSVGVFFIFVCKRKILNQLEQQHPCLKVITGPLKKVAIMRRVTRTTTTTITGRTQTTAVSLRKPTTANGTQVVAQPIPNSK